MATTRTNSGLAADLLIELDRKDREPLHRQVESSIREGIRLGRLRLGTSLPPTRVLAADLGVSRGVVVEAYQQLVAEGYLTSQSGGYTLVAAGPQPPPVEPSRPAARQAARVDFGYGRADVASFPRSAWLRSIRRVLAEAPNERLGYPDGRGAVELREALAEYLDRVRGTCIKAANMVITNGYAQGISLLINVVAARGARRVAFEDPCADDDARLIAGESGLEVVGVPVDADGIEVAALARTAADLVILTPSHQWPTGAVLSAERRAALLRWAVERDVLVVEDDYDAEYRYDRAPIGALQGLARDHVAYAGTASKTLAPGLRIGWMVPPPHLVEPLAAAKLTADRGSPVIEQLAFADFLTRGDFDRHLRRMRPVYRRRRDALLAALADRLPDFEVVGIAAGLHVVALLPPDLDEATLVAVAGRAGVRTAGLLPYRITTTGPSGLIFGYSNLSERAITEGVSIIAEAVAELRASNVEATR